MVNLSPTEESFNESHCSLKFAAQVNQCELGKPKRQIKDICSSSKDTEDIVSELPVKYVATHPKSTSSNTASTPATTIKRPRTTPVSSNSAPGRSKVSRKE